MKIKRMTATFGGLEQAVLTPGDGLTVFTAPNESGKSTWAGFLRAMLYGVDTRERDKAGFLADKTRYLPWSGSPMAGELQVEWQGKDVTIRRFASKAGPFSGFEAVYTVTGDPVPDLTAANVGLALTGGERDVFTRSALVGQNSTAVTAAPELERRIAALATAGQEDVSFSSTQRTLKDWRNRRRANRANGLIPDLEEQLRQTEQALSDMQSARARQEQAREQLARLEERRRELMAEQSVHVRLAQKELNRRYALAQEALERAQTALEQLPAPLPDFSGLTAQQAWELARQQQEEERRQAEAHQRQLEDADQLTRRRKTRKNLMTALVPLLGFGGLLLVILGFVLSLYWLSGVGFASMLSAVAAAILLISLMGNLDRQLHRLRSAQAAPEPGRDLLQAAQDYAEYLSRRERLENEIRHCRERVDDLAAQGGRNYDTLELLSPPARTPAETEGQLRTAELELAHWRSQLDQSIGALRSDPIRLETRRDELERELAERTLEYDALDMALQALDEANGVLRERFSPALNQQAGEIFSALTGGAYTQLSLSRDFSASATPAGDLLPRSFLYLSAGTADQLYLAVRLAICQLTLPHAPLLLDDALAAFDDRRMALALDYLRQLGHDRQILLFSCHSREAAWARANGVASIQL